MGQHTMHTRYHCPCGAGNVVLTTTAFGAGGSRELHTQLVNCMTCKRHYAYSLAQSETGTATAQAEDLRTRRKRCWSGPSKTTSSRAAELAG